VGLGRGASDNEQIGDLVIRQALRLSLGQPGQLPPGRGGRDEVAGTAVGTPDVVLHEIAGAAPSRPPSPTEPTPPKPLQRFFTATAAANSSPSAPTEGGVRSAQCM